MAQKPQISVAPMMDWTDRHCRFFHRLIAPHVRLYTEMVSTGAILYGDRDRHLAFNEAEHPLALQLGGNDPQALAACAKVGAEEYGYDEINLNCGCPSDRVQNGAFGACLMKEPDVVARCVEAMSKAVSIPVTIKCRIGIDDVDDRPFLDRFVRTVSAAGCSTFIIHARKAILKGLSPKENREIPPLRYDIAAEIKQKYPYLTVILNGGIKNIGDINSFCHSERSEESDSSVAALPQNDNRIFDGVMIGREAYQNPYFLADIEKNIFANGHILSREEIVSLMIPYIGNHVRQGGHTKNVTRHMLGLFNNIRGGRHWRRVLSEDVAAQTNISALMNDALSKISYGEEQQAA